jgi:hypothetical protein
MPGVCDQGHLKPVSIEGEVTAIRGSYRYVAETGVKSDQRFLGAGRLKITQTD